MTPPRALPLLPAGWKRFLNRDPGVSRNRPCRVKLRSPLEETYTGYGATPNEAYLAAVYHAKWSGAWPSSVPAPADTPTAPPGAPMTNPIPWQQWMEDD